MKSGSEQMISIISSSKVTLSHYKSTFEKHFKISFFQSISDFLSSLDDQQNRPRVLVLETDSFGLTPLKKISFPVIWLTHSNDLDELRNAYKNGAADICVKPFSENELLARIEKLLDKPRSFDPVIQCNPVTRKVSVSGRTSAELTHRELQIFLSFQAAHEQTLRRAEVIAQVWGSVRVGNKTLDVHLFNLRRKLAKAGLEIRFAHPDSFTLSITAK